MFKVKLILFFILISPISISQGYSFVGARSNSLSNSTVALEDCWSFFHNPGALATITNSEVGISYENKFLLKELQSQAIVYIQPLKKGVLSFGDQLFGFESFRTNKLGVGYGLKLSEFLYSGIQLNYHTIQFSSNYGTINILTAEAGLLAKVSENLKFGFSIFNLGRAKITTKGDERISTNMRLGTLYQLSSKILFTSEFEKNIFSNGCFKTGVEYKPVKNIVFRGGFSTKPIQFSFGLGIILKRFQLDIASAYSQFIGWSPYFSLNVKLGKEKNE
jgi:hypothetical protein